MGFTSSRQKRGYRCLWLAAINMVVQSTAECPTFVRGASSSYIDVTCSTQGVAVLVQNWNVVEEETLSDHKFIYFEITGRNSGYHERIEKTKVQHGRETFRSVLEWTVLSTTDNCNPKTSAELIEQACQVSGRSTSRSRSFVPNWWNEEIDTKRRACKTASRRCTRRHRIGYITEEAQLLEEYKKAKKDLRRAIDASRKKLRLELYDSLKEDIWGDGYRIVTGKLTNRLTADLTTETKLQIVMELFPHKTDILQEDPTCENVVLFTQVELLEAASAMKINKLLGIDGILPEAVKDVIKVAPVWMLTMLNLLLLLQELPSEWIIAKLVLLLKERKTVGHPASYRHSCLLNTLRKLYEWFITKTLQEEIVESGGFADHQ
ncbi:unnamed protein product [Acanthoscelides obtectus]|uniref:Uncharacterized protein n=1 Tax=Acanthoscelides obtectus TaxID=200917 RepID=A0A9P0MG55_ACAOB|nr:unnamed protein product [Acanthoscelides obtectus]CAK1633582.1 hypothetical protein AOBTE_LOCUS8236 [Acanthoscelides obtectus]